MINTVVFDMDGVLVDACEWHRVSLNESLKHFCNYEITLEEHIKNFNGLPTKIKLQMLEEKGIVSKSLFKDIEELKQSKTIEIVNEYAKVRQEKIDLLLFLKSKNIKTACYTNSIKMTANLMLEKTGILDLLDLVVTNQDVAKPKPDPEGYLLCLEKLNTTKENTIIVEDSDKGVKAAIASGCTLLRVKDQEDVTIDLFKGIIL